ncbi:DUF5677 domain-containing protein [Sphingopyxis kveilinensis]|uniref:DUF5677 domain-containing protein n=1 Tax=Sphingopyxis kveilinensis TaxID=3114367 RepID=UPI0030D582D9
MANANNRLTPMLETVKGMREILFSQTRHIDLCLQLLAKQRDGEIALAQGDPEVLRTILTMIHMVGISGHSILKLTDEVALSARDAFPIARSIIEGSINVCFIMAGGHEIAARAVRHAEVKAYRDLQRDWEVGATRITLGYSGQLLPEEVARLNSMLAEFTTKNGREKDWTDKTLKQRLDVIAETFSGSAMVSLNVAAFNIYRHASEIVHGTYFSAAYFWGLTLPGRGVPRTSDEFRLTILDHQFSILVSAIFAYAGLVECFAKYTGQSELHELASKALDRLHELPAIAETLAEPMEGSPTP